MALIRTDGGAKPVSFIAIGKADGTLGNTATGTTSINATGLDTGVTYEIAVANGKYNTLTVSGLSTQFATRAFKGVKSDGTNETITPVNGVFDLTGYVGLLGTFFVQATFSATLS